jgi:hypothetical protein
MVDTSHLVEFQRMAEFLFGKMYSKMDRDIYLGNIVPKHGPGSTAERILGNQKYVQTTWTERLESLFPFAEYALPNLRHYNYDDPPVEWLEPGAETPVRVISVPKTLKTPRIIAIEPVCMMYMQQALSERYVVGVEKDDYLQHFLGFRTQEPNQLMAMEGSRDGSLATLDLSEASDRVSNQLVIHQTESWAWLCHALQVSRSTRADVPGHGIRSLTKFASMGSALCFPLEASVFLTCIFLGIQEELNCRFTDRAELAQFIGKVRVFGDDIVVPKEFVRACVGKLELFGAKVNHDKSFWTGRFRESCGKEYYDGHDVSIVKFRKVFPTHKRHVSELESFVAFRNNAYMAGLWKTATWCDEQLKGLIPFPTVLPTSPALGRHSLIFFEEQRMCPNLQRPLVKALVTKERIPQDHLEGPHALLKYFLKRGDEPFADLKHLERAGRPVAVDIKLRWVSSY